MWLELTQGQDAQKVVVNMANVVRFYRTNDDSRTIIYVNTPSGDSIYSFRVHEPVQDILNMIAVEQERLANLG